MVQTPTEREETTLQEVYSRLLDGKYYDDHDWASGPALRAVRRHLLLHMKAIDLCNAVEGEPEEVFAGEIGSEVKALRAACIEPLS